jgi:hypothetical protein
VNSKDHKESTGSPGGRGICFAGALAFGLGVIPLAFGSGPGTEPRQARGVARVRVAQT